MPRKVKDEDPFSEEVRERLREAMEVQGFNRHSLKVASGVHYTTITQILDGEVAPRSDTLGRLFRAMNVEPHISFE